MTVDIMTLIQYFIGAFACCFGMFLTCKILLTKSLKELKIKYFLLLLLLSVFLILNSLVFDNIVKLFGSFLVLFIICKFIFKKSKIESLAFSTAAYIIFLLGETTYALIISLIDLIFKINFSSTAVKSILANFMISVFACFYARILKKFVSKNIKQLEKSNTIFILILGIITVAMILSSIYILYLNDWIFNYSFILNLVIIAGCIYLFLIVLKEYLNNKNLFKKHQSMNEYLKTSAELIAKYSTTVHKYRNNLIIIKSYINSNNKQAANKYIDELLLDYNTKKYNWLVKINCIYMETVRYFIYYKLIKAEECNLKIIVSVSSDIKDLNDYSLKTRQINTILELIGEYFDNAIYAANESLEKEINFNIYMEDDNLVFELANTYKNEFDLELITKNAYTTKGEGHGLGLYEIQKILKKSNYLQVTYQKIDKYFVVNLIVNIK